MNDSERDERILIMAQFHCAVGLSGPLILCRCGLVREKDSDMVYHIATCNEPLVKKLREMTEP